MAARLVRISVKPCPAPTHRGPGEWPAPVTAARAALGDAAPFEAAWAAGRAMTLEQAIAPALDRSDG